MKTDKREADQSSTIGLFRDFGPPLEQLQKNHYLYDKRCYCNVDITSGTTKFEKNYKKNQLLP